MIKESDIGMIARQIFVKCNRSWHLKGIKTKSIQSPVFNPGGCSSRLRSCLFWEGGARFFVGGLSGNRLLLGTVICVFFCLFFLVML